MAAMLTGFAPFKKKDQYNHDRTLNTRWGDAAISAPMHGGWSAGANNQPQESPDLDRDLPPTPPQGNDVVDGVFIVHDEEGNQSDDDAVDGQGRENVTITIPLPWKKRKDSLSRKQAQPTTTVINPKFAPPKRVDPMPALATAEAAAVLPLPESRVNSPIGRASSTTPVLSFRSRLANPSLADILSPVAEGFAKDGPSSRATPPIPSMPEEEAIPIERPSTSSSLRSNMVRRENMTAAYNSEGLGGMTMSSQAINDDQLPEFNRPVSRGIASTAHMRASSRPRALSRGPRSTSVEPVAHRSGSVEPYTRRAPSVEPIERRAPSVEPITRRAPSVEPITRRAPSVEPVGRRATSVEPRSRSRAPSIEPISHRAPSVEPVSHRATSVEPYYRRAPSVEPVARRAPSVEPVSRRAPSLEPTVYRAASVEPYYRRAPSVEPIMRRAPSVEPTTSRTQSFDPYSRRGHSVEPLSRRGHSVEPRHYQDESDFYPVIPLPNPSDLEPVRQRAPSVEPGRRRAPSVDPLAKRGYSVEPRSYRDSDEDDERTRRRAPSLGAPAARRALSREPRGRRGVSAGPKPRVRFHSEVIKAHRRNSFSSNDGSDESDIDRQELQPSYFSPPSRTAPDFTTTHKPRRRRSIASPITSPTRAVFNISQHAGPSPPPALTTNFDSISSRAGVARPIITPVEKRPQSRNRSTSRARGLYADVQDDFSNVARQVQTDTPIEKRPQSRARSTSRARGLYADLQDDFSNVAREVQHETPIERRPQSRARSTSRARGLYADLQDDFGNVAREVQSDGRRGGDTPVNPPPLITQLPRSAMNFSQRTGSPLSGHPQIYNQAGIGTVVMNNNQYDSDRNGYASDSSQPSLASMSGVLSSDSERYYDSPNGGYRTADVFGRDHRDQYRREERERAREKVARKLERERERVIAANTFAMSDNDSLQSGFSGGTGSSFSGSEKTKNVFGGGERTRNVFGGNDKTRNVFGGGSVTSISDSDRDVKLQEKVLVPNDEDIWG